VWIDAMGRDLSRFGAVDGLQRFVHEAPRSPKRRLEAPGGGF
jgi:hypothetical protein